MQYSTVSEVPKHDGKRIALRGWVYRHRAGKGVAFFVLRDTTGYVQCTAKGDVYDTADKLTMESSIALEGTVIKDERAPGGYEVRVDKLSPVQIAERFPITKDQSPEFLLDQRHLWIRSKRMSSIFKVRSTCFDAFREYFLKEDFYEFHSPIITKNACEGATTLFEMDYFGEPAYLSQTWQLYAEAMLPGMEKIFTIAPSFRAEKSRSVRHLAEYWHAEIELAWCDLKELISHGERVIEHMSHRIADERGAELEALGADAERLRAIKAPFYTITYQEALKLLEKDGVHVPWGKDLRTIEEKKLTEHFDKPVSVTNYPKEAMAFYKPADPKDKETALCFDMLAPGIGELIGGSMRDMSIPAMKKELKKDKADLKAYEWYFDTRRYGGVPHGGWGMGMERFLMWALGLETIKDAIPFPRTMDRVTP
ncbi:MAG: asparagine--tRNA ligase [Candidatus Diapherotrites archaeon]|nr:asparagine--tRNA ligase [Candidatus Diapherotrites archaeon]